MINVGVCQLEVCCTISTLVYDTGAHGNRNTHMDVCLFLFILFFCLFDIIRSLVVVQLCEAAFQNNNFIYNHCFEYNYCAHDCL